MSELPGLEQSLQMLADLKSRRGTSKLKPCPVDRPLVLYGAGNLGQLAADLFARLDIDVVYAVDRQPRSEPINGRIPVVEPDNSPLADRRDFMIAVCIVTTPYQPVRDFLETMGWRHIYPVYDLLQAYADRLPMSNGWFAGLLTDDDWCNIERVLRGWRDDWSRAAYLQFLAWRLARAEWRFSGAPVSIGDRYFIEPVTSLLTDHEYFLDAGAWNGVVSQRFVDETGGSFRRIAAVEADPRNAERLREWKSKLPETLATRIDVLQTALAEKNAGQPFSEGFDMASRLQSGASHIVRTHTLDELDIPVTFAKFHLEGGELNALEGGARTLQQYRPIIAVTVYHNSDGLWRIPLWFWHCLPEYRLLFRMHGWCGTGAVLYALPNERVGGKPLTVYPAKAS
ncbi:FkbM family methyltransferase [Methylomarinum vadi]|uniref:FkbM family methyltransferase n=1 Tax=Methylomarinum vadi TaxID=438855 RepID=UPI0012694E57|nr:FkbM family methyltransferase [Methylomarinum vadi]